MPQTTGATQKIVDIKEVKDGIIYMKNGGLRKVMMVNGINFELYSQEEQEITLGSFQRFLNRLDFPVEFFIHSRKINIKSYLDKIREHREKEDNQLLKIQIEEYINFVDSFVKDNPIITKSFFVVVPYDSNTVMETAQKGVSGIFSSLSGGGGGEKEDSFEKKLKQLSYRVDEVVAGLEQIGLRITELNDDELVELFYNLYNPQLIEKERGNTS
jgi:type IV secretory pathway VirB4 component